MREALIPMEAYTADVGDGSRWAGHPTQPHGWFSVTHVAYRAASLPEAARLGFLSTLPETVLPNLDRRPTHHCHELPPPRDALARAAERLRVAAEDMERDSCFEMAFTTVSSAARIVARHDAAGAIAAHTQLARIARQLGDVANAEVIYQGVADDAQQRGFPSLAGYALAGLGNLAIMRGNRPAQWKLFSEALAVSPEGSALEGAARWGLMNHALAVDSLPDALIHGWRAFDLATADEQRAGILSNLASVAHRAKFHKAAHAGFAGALRMRVPTQLWLGIAASAAVTAGTLRCERVLFALEEEGRRRSGEPLPFEQAQWLLGLAQGWEAEGTVRAALQFAREARVLALSHEFHELAYRTDDILDRLTEDVPPTCAPEEEAPSASNLPESAQVGLARLLAVAS